jgi:flagellar biosynthesis/type III secretory pathway chaperone
MASAQEAENLIARFIEVMDALADVVQQETHLIRAGRLSAAAKLHDAKGKLAQSYIVDTLRLRASEPRLPGILSADRIDALQRRHESLRALLQINLTVLATAHAVSEGIVRGISGEMARKAAPQTYGASGRALAPPASAAQPLALSRTL